MICYNARVILRVVVLVACLFAAAPAFAQPVGLTTGGHPVMAVSSAGIPGEVSGTSGSMAPGMRPGVPGAPGAKHPYFYAAYAAVWLGLFGYVLWLASRMKAFDRGR